MENGLVWVLFHSNPGYLVLGFINTKMSLVRHKPQQIYPQNHRNKMKYKSIHSVNDQGAKHNTS